MKNNSGTVAAAGREVFEAKVGIEAVKRAGSNPNLKGIVHEILYKDIYNLSPGRIIDGNKATLSKSATAVRDDVLIRNGGKIVGRMQLKDTPASIGKTISQVANKHYAGTKLVGTKETVAAYEKAIGNAAKHGKNITQKMSSSKISSSDTSRIATKTLGSGAGKLAVGAVGRVAASSGAIGAVISGGVEAALSGVKLKKGEITKEEFAEKVAKETAGGGISAAAGSAVATVAATGMATVLSTTTAPLWVPAAAGVGAAVITGYAVKSLWDKAWEKAENIKEDKKCASNV